MSNENKKNSSRPYRQKARARRRDQVHRRITKAAVHLHQTVGPARTTMNAIAERAGVQRATVYNHFPTELELIDACSSHWFAENPPPDPTSWTKIDDPIRRTGQALADMYDYYDRGREMLGKVLRDAPIVPAMDEIRRMKWQPLIDGIADILARDWPLAEEDGQTRLRAGLSIALDFFTWQKLSAAGLSNDQAAKLATIWVEAGVSRS